MIAGVLGGEYQLFFFTPELLIDQRKWREALKSEVFSNRMKALIIDEAHTVKKWQEDTITA